MADHTIKGLPAPPTKYDGSALRIGIVHARWNDVVIKSLVAGTVNKLKEQGVKEENIVIKSVPGSYELPFATQKLIAGGKAQSAKAEPSLIGATNLLGSLVDEVRSGTPAPETKGATREFDAVIAIGVLIKGSTMHFEYISEAVTHGLMRVQLDTGTPVVFGVLTALTDEQALVRAGIGSDPQQKGHNHGEDWGLAAVELAASVSEWGKGSI
ncbi:6,7-dimethyl-8-ribityllumazine synthase [Vanrija pseudolonga]|uniref:6,7-dimethyl-8-ribityllumazine synthase n=1 Tax=Vanrija pseudolonga TaxID=143232 RepID=A0AAF0YBA9_9TREE|nr:6,7-dimethyl-8-ribityllumazine synthase [Vanrija pseudolonga]